MSTAKQSRATADANPVNLPAGWAALLTSIDTAAATGVYQLAVTAVPKRAAEMLRALEYDLVNPRPTPGQPGKLDFTISWS